MLSSPCTQFLTETAYTTIRKKIYPRILSNLVNLTRSVVHRLYGCSLFASTTDMAKRLKTQSAWHSEKYA